MGDGWVGTPLPSPQTHTHTHTHTLEQGVDRERKKRNLRELKKGDGYTHTERYMLPLFIFSYHFYPLFPFSYKHICKGVCNKPFFFLKARLLQVSSICPSERFFEGILAFNKDRSLKFLIIICLSISFK